MKAKEIKAKSLNGDLNMNRLMAKRILIKSISTLLIVLILGIICYSHQENLSKLSILNNDVFFYLGVAFGLISFICIIFSTIIIFNENYITSFVGYYIYSTHDILNFLIDIVYIIFFVLAFIVTPTTVSGSSMANTLYDQDKLLVWHLGYNVTKDDIVIIDINDINYNVSIDEQFYIKRVVAVEGSVVSFNAYSSNSNYGDIIVDGEIIDSNVYYNLYVRMTSLYNNETNSYDTYFDESIYTMTVPEGYNIVLGDNRQNSNDSRYIGMIHNEDILGKAIFRYYSYYGSFGLIKKNIKS